MMLSVAIRVSVVLLLTGVVAFGLRRASAALRHAVWAVGLFVALALPLASFALPAWSVIPVSTAMSSVATETGIVTLFGSRAHASVNPMTILGVMWGVGALIALVRIVLGELALNRWKHRAHPVFSAAWRDVIADITNRSAHSPNTTFLECDWISAPCTWGTIQPVVLLPTAGSAWTRSQRECALLHELAHVQRFDSATQLLGRLACALYWFNPLVWLASREARVAQEEACDNAVLAERVVPSDYAALLIGVCGKNTSCGGNMIAALGLVRATGTETRVRSVLDAHRRRSPLSRRITVIVSLFGTATLFSVATVSPAQNRPVTQPKPDSATMAQLVKRICDGRVSMGDSNVVARFTVRGRFNQGPDSTARRMVEYTVDIKGCGKQTK